jgi:hypothetical protein
MKIALVGTAISSRLLAPYNDKDWEIWATGPASMGMLPKVDVWFELHSLDRIFDNPAEEDYLAALSRQPRVVTQNKDPRIPGSVKYPKDEMVARHGAYFFTSSVAWMLAYALEQKPEELGLYGIDMAHDSERAIQKPACHFFIQKFKEAGIKITVPPESDLLCPPPLYGYCEDFPMWRKLAARRTELENRIASIRNQRVSLGKQEAELSGALEDVDYVQNTWAGSE